MRTVTRFGWGLVSSAALVVACGGEKPSNPEGPLGSLHAALTIEEAAHDVTSMYYKVVAAGDACDGEALAETTVSLEGEALPNSLQPDGGGDNHRFADALFVLAPGDYHVCVTPMSDEGPSQECAPTGGDATVVAEETTEVLLVSQCEGDPNGGLDVITVLNDPPVIDDLLIEPSKFITECEEAAITVTASDPNGDGVTYGWEVSGGSVSGDGDTATFTPSGAGDYEVTVTITDVYDAATTLSFPIHVTEEDCDTDGETALWTRQFGSTSTEYGESVSVDSSGNVLVAGWTGGALPGQTSSGSFDAFVRKYDADGTELWTRQFGSTFEDFGQSVSVDSSGNVLVAGYTRGTLPGQTSSGGDDAFVRKLDADGNELWTRQFGSTSHDNGSFVSVDPSGNVLVAGSTLGALPGQTASGLSTWNAFVRKLDADGNELWTQQFGSTISANATSVSVDPSGNVLVAGVTTGTLPGQTASGGMFSSDAFVRKLDADGNELWTQQFGSTFDDWAYSVSVDPSGNVLVAGTTNGALPGQTSSASWNAFVRKLDADGDELWTRQFDSPDGARGNSVSIDSSGNVLVAGFTYGALPGQTSSGDGDAFVRKLDADGNELWTQQFGSASYDYGNSVSVDSSGNVLVAGFTEGVLPGQTSSGSYDAFVTALAP